MVRLTELLNDFNPMSNPQERNEGHYKAIDLDINGKNFELQYQEMRVPLDMCLMYAEREQSENIKSSFSSMRKALNFQFYYVDEHGGKTQEVQSFPDGTIFPLIKKIGEFLKYKEADIDTLLFGGDADTRTSAYDVFAKRISREGDGWTIVKASGAGPSGQPGMFWALFKNGS